MEIRRSQANSSKEKQLKSHAPASEIRNLPSIDPKTGTGFAGIPRSDLDEHRAKGDMTCIFT
jgi:hypothetical protein